MSVKCQKVKQQDEFFCARCELRWLVDDDNPPRCIKKGLRKRK